LALRTVQLQALRSVPVQLHQLLLPVLVQVQGPVQEQLQVQVQVQALQLVPVDSLGQQCRLYIPSR